MTTREELMAVVEVLDDEQLARLLGYAEELVHRQYRTNGTTPDASEPAGDDEEFEDELTNAVPKPGLSPESSIWRLAGFIDDDGPTDMASDKYKYFPQVYGDLHEERDRMLPVPAGCSSTRARSQRSSFAARSATAMRLP